MTILFVGERNVSRSIMAEAILRRVGGSAVDVHSAGRTPGARVSLYALETLRQAGYPIEDLTPKSWKVFDTISAPSLDVVVTLDNALKKGPFPIWYSHPVYVHWPFPDPDAISDDDARREAYRRLYAALEQQMLKLMGLMQGPTRLRGADLRARLQALMP